jgi:hypothetical protein
MPLLDHFHPPLHPTHSWESFHSRWANAIADALDRILPGRFFAEVQVHLGSRVEADVAEFEILPSIEAGNGASGGVAVQTWAPPAAAQTVRLIFPDDFEVQVFDLRGGGRRLAAVIELVSPGNKDRPEERRAFAAKCLAYLQRGIGLIVVDIVTPRRANLHAELLALMGQADGEGGALAGADLYAVAYRPARRDEANLLDLWPTPLAVGRPLPLLPLALRGAFFVPVDLEASYTEARQRSRL